MNKIIEYETGIVPVVNETIAHAIHVSLYNSEGKEDLIRLEKLAAYMPIGSKLKITIEVVEDRYTCTNQNGQGDGS